MVFLPNFKKRIGAKFHKIFLERFEYIRKEIPNQIVEESEKTIIPNIVYQTWINKELPWRMWKEIKKFRELNHDYSFILFSDEERDEYMKNSWGDRKIYDLYKNSVFQASKADIWRYCILYEKGGYYFDIKSSCETPLSKLIKSHGTSLTFEQHYTYIVPSEYILKNDSNFNINTIANWGMGFSKKHPLLEIIISNIEEVCEFFRDKKFPYPKPYILSFTGPGMLTKSYRDYLEKYNSIIEFNGVNFFGEGIYQVKGSQYRFLSSPHYKEVKNSKILL